MFGGDLTEKHSNYEMYIETDKKYIGSDSTSLPFILYTVGYARSQPAVTRPNGYETHQMLWVENGSGIFSAGGESFVLNKGEGFFWRRHVPHSYKKNGECFHTAWFTFMCSDGILDYYSLPDYFKFSVTPLFISQIKELHSFCRSDSTVLSRSAAGYSLFADWLTENFEPALTTEAVVKKYLENNYSRPVTLEETAQHAGMSKYALCHYYKKHCGCSVMDQLKKIRIAKSKQLLSQMPLRTEEVGRMCGFDNPSYFCKIFREETGRTPLEYRKKHNK